MQYLVRKAGATSQILPVSVYDSSSTVGAKLAGLVYNSGSLTAYYNRIGAAGAATVITLVTATKGTWTSSGFVAIDGTNMPGDYELHIPDAVLAAGAVGVMIQLKGAANMVPVNIYIDLTLFDLQVATQKTDIETIKTRGVTCAADVTVLASVGTAATNTAQTGDSFARIGANGASLTALGDARLANLDVALSVIAAYIDTEVATIVSELAKVPKSDSTVSWNNTALAAINAQVVDGLATDTYAEPAQGAPAATASLSAKIGYLYKAWRNKTEQTATQYSLYADNTTTVDQKAAVSDDSVTFSRAEIASGP